MFLVGLDDIDVVGVVRWTTPLQVHIASTTPRPSWNTVIRALIAAGQWPRDAARAGWGSTRR